MQKKIIAVVVSVCFMTALNLTFVKAAKKPYIKVSSATKVSILKGKTTKIQAKTIGKSRKITYKSSKKSVASVNSKGTVKGKKYGNTVIYMTAKGMKTKKVIVSVKRPITGLTLKSANVVTFSKPGKTSQIKASVKPSKQIVTSKLTYKRSNTKVVSVNSKGKITAKGAGYAKITISTSAKAGKIYKRYVDVYVNDDRNQIPTQFSGGKTIFTLNPEWKSVRVNFKSNTGKVYSYTITENIKEKFDELARIQVPFKKSSGGVCVTKNDKQNLKLINFAIEATKENYDVIVDNQRCRFIFTDDLVGNDGKLKVYFDSIVKR